ncbi:uncharacterized protein LOC142984923 [Anticarsia gemmatalis]|uniref:uncharacterized protein LOC142984923 n=1 Tax=Anticarsia gemmatalis TaxID=129554 RepID=UPI003F75DF6B
MYTFFILFNIVVAVLCKDLVIKAGLEELVPSSIGLKFYTEMRNSGREGLSVEVYPDECCLENGDSKCDIVEMVGGATDVIDAGSTKTLKMVAPLIDFYDRKGYCTVYIDSRPVARPKNIVRDTIKINFNTRLRNPRFRCDHIDEDPFNQCKPVDCDIYYNGKRSYFSETKRQCENVPSCISRTRLRAYNPVSNKCILQPSITKDDIKFITELANSRNRFVKDVLLINAGRTPSPEEPVVVNCNVDNSKGRNNTAKLKSREKNVSKATIIAKEIDKGKSRSNAKIESKLKAKTGRDRFNLFLVYLCSNKTTVTILGLVIFLQCCLICTMVYCMSKNCMCKKKKTVVNKFFNYRQDASVTTPLIGTSNMDTETTEYQYMSESSNYIDKKIRCYKACQKERKNNIKLSMSDDILSKCLTRRDWQRVPRSEAIPEITSEDILQKEVTEIKKPTETKVNFQEEHMERKSKPNKSGIIKETKNTGEVFSDFSEKEICCHSYNYDCFSNKASLKKPSQGKTFEVFNQEKRKTNSIEKGAQVYFSNDSMDDFLSERGVIFIGDNASKYSFTSISSAKSSASSQSSKTSKNNIVKNVISLLSKKTKGPASDPGVKKSKAELDLELLHISRASVFSSSNETDGGKDLKRIKESTSSL